MRLSGLLDGGGASGPALACAVVAAGLAGDAKEAVVMVVTTAETVKIEGTVWRLDPQIMLMNAHSQLKTKRDYRAMPLWAFVSRITGHGSTASVAICQMFGWDAFQETSKAKLTYASKEQPQ